MDIVLSLMVSDVKTKEQVVEKKELSLCKLSKITQFLQNDYINVKSFSGNKFLTMIRFLSWEFNMIITLPILSLVSVTQITVNPN